MQTFRDAHRLWESFNVEMFGCCRTATEVGYVEISCWHLPEYHGAIFLGRMERTGCLGCSEGLCLLADLAVRRALRSCLRMH